MNFISPLKYDTAVSVNLIGREQKNSCIITPGDSRRNYRPYKIAI